MKQIFLRLSVMASFCLLLCCCQSPKVEHKGVLDIQNAGNMSVPVPDRNTHKPFDVEVYALPLMGSIGYKIIYYQQESDSLKSHGAMYGDTTAVYTKAAYNWQNDTVHVRLYNDTSKKEVKFKLYGHGSSNAMADDK